MSRVVRIGNAQAFWGDRNTAAAEMLALEPELDYLTLDYLAEVSLSLLAAQQMRDPHGGYPRDFVQVVRSLAPYWSAGGRCRLITNAGGLNPRACAEACAQVLADAGCRPVQIAVVTGDDVAEYLRQQPWHADFCNLDTGAAAETIIDRLVTAHAYLGAAPLVEALRLGADIVISGRVADPSLCVAAAVHHWGWSEDDWSRLAGATVAGHLIECGTQVTGGLATDWLNVPDVAHLGYPLVEIAADGSCTVTKPRGSGGCVTAWTVKEQLLYEIGDPACYLSPDVQVSLMNLHVEDLGDHRVRVWGAEGFPAPQRLKVSATYRDGYRAAGTLTIFGRDAVLKARRAAEIVLQRVREAGLTWREAVVETLGAGGCYGRVLPLSTENITETVLRIALESDTRETVDCFARELMPLITAGPPGTTGYAEGRPHVHPVVRYWPCLIDRSLVKTQVAVWTTAGNSHPKSLPVTESPPAHTPSSGESAPTGVSWSSSLPPSSSCPAGQTLRALARARSGDKGRHANIGIIARHAAAFEFLKTWLTAERVADFLAPLGHQGVERYEWPNLSALNFVVRGVLQHSLRTDAQGKALGELLLELPLPSDVPVCVQGSATG